MTLNDGTVVRVMPKNIELKFNDYLKLKEQTPAFRTDDPLMDGIGIKQGEKIIWASLAGIYELNPSSVAIFNAKPWKSFAELGRDI